MLNFVSSIVCQKNCLHVCGATNFFRRSDTPSYYVRAFFMPNREHIGSVPPWMYCNSLRTPERFVATGKAEPFFYFRRLIKVFMLQTKRNKRRANGFRRAPVSRRHREMDNVLNQFFDFFKASDALALLTGLVLHQIEPDENGQCFLSPTETQNVVFHANKISALIVRLQELQQRKEAING